MPRRPVRPRRLAPFALLTLSSLMGLAAGRTPAIAQTAGDYRSVGSGLWTSLSIWETFDGTSWVAASAPPTSSDGVIEIQSGNVVSIGTPVTYDQVVVDAGGALNFVGGVSTTLADGPGTDLVVNGWLVNQGGTWNISSGTSWAVGAGGTYVHNTTAAVNGPLLAATLDPASTFIYRGSSSLVPGVVTSGVTYGNLSFESTSGAWSGNPNGAGALTVNGDFTVGPNVTLNVTQTGLMTFAGNYTINGTLANQTGTQSYDFTGAGKTIGGTGSIAFENLEISPGASIAVQHAVTIASSFTGTVDAGATLEVNAALTADNGALVVNGTLQRDASGSFVNSPTYGATSTLVYNGVSVGDPVPEWIPGGGGPGLGLPQNVTLVSGTLAPTGPMAVAGDLTLSGGALAMGAGAGANLDVGGNLALNGGALSTSGSNFVRVAGSVTRTGGYVDGNLERSVAGPGAYTFDVGAAGIYSPVTLNFSGLGAGGFLGVRANAPISAPGAAAGLSASKYVNRSWTVTNTTLASPVYDATFNFDPADVQGAANPGNLIVAKFDGSGWTNPAVGTRTATSTQATGMTSFSDFYLGEAGCPVITLSPGTLPDATVGVAYSQSLAASGGAGPYTFTVTAGALPAGLSLSSAGVLSGTPTTAGPSSFDVTATDANACTGVLTYSLTTNPPPSNTVTPVSATACITPAHPCQTIPVNIARTDTTGLRLFHVTFQLSPELQLCGTPTASILEGSYLSGANPSTTFLVVDNGGGSYTVDGTINGTPCGATAAGGNLFNIQVTNSGGSGTGTVTISALTLRDCSNNTLASTIGAPASVTIDTAPVTVAAIASPQTVAENSALTVTPSATLSACATGPLTWSVSPALPTGATFNTGTGEIQWTPACGTTGTYGPFTLTATAASGDAGASNAFTIDVTHQAGAVTVAAISDPQTVVENSLLSVTPAATLAGCATGPVTWSVSPALPAGATLDTGTGEIQWTPACGTTGTYGPFTLTATAATGETGASNTFSIDVAHLAGTVTVAAITSLQTTSEGTPLTITPSATTTACAGTLTWTVAPALPAGATLNGATGEIQWTPDCAAAEGGAAGSYGPFTLTATASTGELGAGNAFTIQVNDTPIAVGAPASASATQVRLGNPAGQVTGITVHFGSVAGATTYLVYRAPFGHYPSYDDGGGAAPTAPTSFPPAAPWTLTGVTTDGGIDTPPSRDVWYYVAYAANGCGDFSVASPMTGGTLDYHLGDVSDNLTPGTGDNLVDGADLSLLGAHYGINLAPNDPFGFLDVGPTTTGYVDGRPLTDNRVDFEDLVLFAINYGEVSTSAARTAPPLATDASRAITPAATDALTIATPAHVAPGDDVAITLSAQGTGLVQALSAKLTWNPAVVQPAGTSAGDLLQAQNGLLLSGAPGTLDVAVLGSTSGLVGEGSLATIRFNVLAEGDPGIALASVEARDARNRKVTMGASSLVESTPTVTALAPVMPNPSRGTATLAYALAKRGPVDLSIYSVDGRLVRRLVHATVEPGSYSIAWDGRDQHGAPVAGGVFFARMTTEHAKFTRTLTRVQ